LPPRSRISKAPDSSTRTRSPEAHLQGLVEWPQVPKFVIITVPIDAGFPAIEAAIETWMTRLPEAEWNFGNIYEGEGRPIGWWV
jgi:hypothetical protein